MSNSILNLRLCPAALVAVFFLTSRPSLAWDDWQPIDQQELAMKFDPAHPADAIMLYHEETCDDNTRHAYVYKRVKILTEKGRKWADVRVFYDQKYSDITDIKARTIAPDGTITAFAGKAFSSTVVRGRGAKWQAKTFTLPNVEVGSIIEWKYTEYWEEYVRAPHWTVDDELSQKRAKFAFLPFFKQGHYIVDKERDVILNRVYYTFIGLPQNTAIKTIGDNRMELELKDIAPFEEEPYSPPEAVLRKRVNFYYGTDKMGKPEEFWKEEGKYWNKEVEKFIGHSSAVAAAASQAVGASDTPEQKARKIYAQVEKMKNLTYASGEDFLEWIRNRDEKEKRTIDDVLRNGEGFRDELVRLFVAMARAVNIPAYAMRVADRDEVFFQKTIPNRYQLTSEIAVVTLDGKDVFLDPGTPSCPFGTLRWQHTLTEGIRQTQGGGTELGLTKTIAYKDAVTKRFARLALADDGSLRGKVAIAWVGTEALDHRLTGLRTDEAGRKKELEDELRRLLPSSATVHFESATGWEDAEKQLVASFAVEVPSFASNAGKRTLVPTALFETNERQPFSGGERKNALYFSYPYYIIDDVQITVPQNLHLENLPQTPTVQTDFAFYQAKRTATGNVLAFSRDFAMGSIGFRPEEYGDVRKFFAGVTAGDSEQAILTSAPK